MVLQDRRKHNVLTPLIIKRNYFSESLGKSIIKQIQIWHSTIKTCVRSITRDSFENLFWTFDMPTYSFYSFATEWACNETGI